MSRYKNICGIILEADYSILTSEKEFTKSQSICFRCIHNHICVMSASSFINKTSPKKMYKDLSLCGKCNIHLNVLQKANQNATKLGFKIIKLYEDNLNLEYICACGKVNKSDVKNISRSTRGPHCPKCQNDSKKNSYQDIKNIFQNHDCELLIEPNEYINNKQRLKFRCKCGSFGEIIINDLKRGRLCLNCRDDRRTKTCIKKYGVPSPSQNKIIKQKIVDTNNSKYGVNYIMQSAEMFRKAQQKSFHRKKYISPFGKEFNIMGYENIFLDSFFKKYGNSLEIYGGEDVRIPTIDYMFNGKNRKYYPDFYIPSLNEIIEIKSIYLYEKDKEKILVKGYAVESLDYKFKLIVYKNRNDNIDLSILDM